MTVELIEYFIEPYYEMTADGPVRTLAAFQNSPGVFMFSTLSLNRGRFHFRSFYTEVQEGMEELPTLGRLKELVEASNVIDDISFSVSDNPAKVDGLSFNDIDWILYGEMRKVIYNPAALDGCRARVLLEEHDPVQASKDKARYEMLLWLLGDGVSVTADDKALSEAETDCRKWLWEDDGMADLFSLKVFGSEVSSWEDGPEEPAGMEG